MRDIIELVIKAGVFVVAALAFLYFTGYLDAAIHFLRTDAVVFLRKLPEMLRELPDTIRSLAR